MKAEIDRPIRVGDAVIAAVARGGYMHFVIEVPQGMRVEKLSDGATLEEWRRMVYQPRGVQPKSTLARENQRWDEAAMNSMIRSAHATKKEQEQRPPGFLGLTSSV
jgi:hypothetical protein